MKLLNYTARSIRFVQMQGLRLLGNNRFEVSDESQLRVIREIPVAGPALRIRVQPMLDQLCLGIPVICERLTGADVMPEGPELLLVSKQYAEAVRRMCWPTERLRIVTGGVFVSGKPFPIAATSISTVEACLGLVLPGVFSPGMDEDDRCTHISQFNTLGPAQYNAWQQQQTTGPST